MMHTDPLGSRLHNCLSTILELEASLEETPLAAALQNEFSVLKEVVKRLEQVKVEESDVCRIEAATGRFLAELKETMGRTTPLQNMKGRLLQ